MQNKSPSWLIGVKLTPLKERVTTVPWYSSVEGGYVQGIRPCVGASPAALEDQKDQKWGAQKGLPEPAKGETEERASAGWLAGSCDPSNRGAVRKISSPELSPTMLVGSPFGTLYWWKGQRWPGRLHREASQIHLLIHASTSTRRPQMCWHSMAASKVSSAGKHTLQAAPLLGRTSAFRSLALNATSAPCAVRLRKGAGILLDASREWCSR